MFNPVIDKIRSLYGESGFIPLHEPRFSSRDKELVIDCLDSTFVSSVGKYVDQFEKMVCDYTGSKFAVATMNGTAALHIALLLSGVEEGDEVLTQALTFVATANAISYARANPIFIDSAEDNLGMDPKDLEHFLKQNAELGNDGFCYNKFTKKRIKACVPMHVFGHPVKLDQIVDICQKYNIALIEDAAESLGSYYKGKHTGTIAPIGILSFNGNKTITCGGGGMILLQDEALAKRAKHLTTTGKNPHRWEFFHSEVAYNYRLPNLNAALACAQMESLSSFVENKVETAKIYRKFFNEMGISFVDGPEHCQSNFWLNAIVLKDKAERDAFLMATNEAGVMTRPIWRLMDELPAFDKCQKTELKNAHFYEERVVNIPSSVRVS